MRISLLWRCLLVSTLISAVGPALTMTMFLSTGDAVIDISEITAEELEEATPEEAEVIILDKAKQREITGIVDRFTYPFSHPQIWWYYFETAISIFCLVLPATIVASFWNVRSSRHV